MRAVVLGGMVLAVAGVTTGGCGGGNGQSDAPAKASQACATLHAAGAQRSARCLGGAVADWQAYNDGIEMCAIYDAHVANHLVVYFPNKYQACLDRLASSCDDDPRAAPCFYEVLEGQIADGAPCIDTLVCGVVSACLNLSVNACAATCVRPGTLDEACDLLPCGAGLTCVDGTCAPQRLAGEACGGEQRISCAPPLFCDVLASGAQGTCVAHQAGEACQADSECSYEQFCLAGACTPRRRLGTSCEDAPTGCAPWTVCESSTRPATCVAAGRPGQRCAVYPGIDLPFWCMGAASCGPDDTCVALARPGESCVTSSCVDGSTCDATTVTCVPCGS